MPPLSIIIPVWGNLGRLEDTLLSVLENRPEDAEIVVVLDEPYEDPYDLKADGVRFLQTPPRSGLAASLNLGIEGSRGPLIHVLACGALVREGWADAAMTHFANPWVAAVVPLALDIEDPERVVAAGMTYSRGGGVRILGQGRKAAAVLKCPPAALGPHLSAAFYRKSALEMAGRFSPSAGDRLAAVDLALRLAYAGFRTVFEPQSVVCVERAEKRPTGAFRGALHTERLFWRWAPCFGWLTSLPLHAITVGLELVTALPRPAVLGQLAGRTLGLCYFASGRRTYREVQQLREQARASVSAAGTLHARNGASPRGADSLARHAGRSRKRKAAQ